MLKVMANYYVYDRASNKRSPSLQKPRWREFQRTCERICMWSLRREVWTDDVLQVHQHLRLHGDRVPEEEWLEMPMHPKAHVYAETQRHFQRVASAIQSLVQLAAVPEVLFGDYEPLFVEHPRWAGRFITWDRRFAPLTPTCWPDDPCVPPFMVRTYDHLFSPVPLEGLKPMGAPMAGRPLPFVFRVHEEFAEAEGWHSLNVILR